MNKHMWETQVEVIRTNAVHEVGDWRYSEGHSTPETQNRNSENGNREWSANMAIRLVTNRKRKASRTSRILRTYKKKYPPTIL